MAYLEVEGLTKIYGAVTAVNGIDFSVERGKMIAILGGSGCGKTTTLRMIAGFTAPSAGVIRIDGKVIGGIPAHKRNIGMFFQNYALFPHLSTYDNIAFGLKLKKLKKAEIKRRVDEALQMVRLEGLEKRLPRELSGGQQQRVALARALVTEPALLLLDEPLSNLDAKLRADMQIELRRIHRATGITAIIVTHDQEEAMSLADRIIVMKDGDIRQNASPFLVYNRPVDPDIADFMGIANFIPVTVEETRADAVFVRCQGDRLEARLAQNDFKPGDEALLAIRANHAALRLEPAAGFERARVQSSTYKGGMTYLQVSCKYNDSLTVCTEESIDFQAGATVYISLPAEKSLLYLRNERF